MRWAGGQRGSDTQIRQVSADRSVAGIAQEPRHCDAVSLRAERHKRARAVLKKSRERNARASGLIERLLMAGGLLAAGAWERLAWWRFIRRRPSNTQEAQTKILYLLAVVIADGARLQANDVATSVASLARFQRDIASFLQRMRA
jgi:hypothetical protein